jgi:hypothetical protein
MSKRITISRQTQANWLIDAAVFVGAVLAAITGIYFLFIPSGGFQGGRNPMHGITILFSRHTWNDLHTWGGVLMIAAVVVHLAIHWGWVKMITRRTYNSTRSRGSKLSQGAKINITVDMAIAVSFLLTAVSGIYFLFAPSSGYQVEAHPNWSGGLLLSATTWDLLHTWSGTVLVVAALVHFAIHWRWVKNVTVRFWLSLWQRPRANSPAVVLEGK